MSDQKSVDYSKFEKWFNNYTNYFKVNKGVFDRFLEAAGKDINYFKTYTQTEYLQNVNLMGEMFTNNIQPFKALMDQKAINAAIVAKTKDKQDMQVVEWYNTMYNNRQVLQGIAQQINKLIQR
jgi:hypothetical protein